MKFLLAFLFCVTANATLTGPSSGGGGSVTYPLAADDGTVGGPSYSFESDPTIGFFYAGSTLIGVGGNLRLPYSGTVYFRNVDDNGDVPALTYGSASHLTLGDGSHPVNILGGSQLSITADYAQINSPHLLLFTGSGTEPALNLADADGDKDVQVKAPAVLTEAWIFTLPPDNGANGQVLTTNGSGVATWETASGGMANPMTTDGDIIYGGASGLPTRLPKGANGNVLVESPSTLPIWASASTPIYMQGANIIIEANTTFTAYSADLHFNIGGNGSSTGCVRLLDADVSNGVCFRVPNTVASDYSIILPAATASTNQILYSTDGASTLDWRDPYDVDLTITATGTTGVQTINKMGGRVNIEATASSKSVTNSLVSTSTNVFATAQTNDSTCQVKNVVPGAGSFVINMTAACTAETAVAFTIEK